MENYIDILKEAKEKGILLDSCGKIERQKDGGLYIDFCGATVKEMTPKGGGGGGADGFHFEVVAELPETGEGNVLYLVGPKEGEDGEDLYEEWIWDVDNNSWLKIGDSTIDLSDYYTKEESAEVFEAKSNKVTTLDSGSTDEQYPSAKAVYTAIKSGGGGNSPFVPGEGENSAVLDNGSNKAIGNNSVAKGLYSTAQGHGSSAEGGGLLELTTLVFSGEPSATEYAIISDESGDIWNLPIDTEIKYNGITTKFLGTTWHDDNSYFNTEETLSDEEITEGKGLCRVFGGTFAIGTASHSEGAQTFALGISSHAEGDVPNNAIKTTFVFSNDGGNTVFAITDDPNNESSYLLDGAIFGIDGGFLYPLVKFGEKFTRIIDVYIDSNDNVVGFETIGTLSDEELSDASGLTIFKPYGAYGNSSHVEGVRTLALSEGTHAEGEQSIAEGDYSHAEGCGHAGYNYAHAEGCSFAFGEYSHAEGGGAAFGEASHAEAYSLASGNCSHAEGANDNGYYSITASVDDYSDEFYMQDPISVNEFPVGSHVWLNSTIFEVTRRSNDYRFTLNNFSAPFPMEDVTIDIITRGAFGDFSHVEGNSTTASGESSHAEGQNSAAIGACSHAEGESSISSGFSSHAEGQSASLGDFSHSEGASSTNDFDGQIYVSGDADDVLYTFDDGATLTVEQLPVGSLVFIDRGNIIIGGAPDMRVIVSRPDASSFVVNETFDDSNAIDNAMLFVFSGAFGEFSHVEGFNNSASSALTHAEGSNNIAFGYNSHVEGSHNIALNEFEHAQGVYNLSHTGEACDDCDCDSPRSGGETRNANNRGENDDPSVKTLFSIGNGSESGRKNAVEVMQNGATYIEGVGGYDGEHFTQANSLQSMFSNGFIRKFELITQDDYDELDPKDPNTIYFIAEEAPCDCEECCDLF